MQRLIAAMDKAKLPASTRLLLASAAHTDRPVMLKTPATNTTSSSRAVALVPWSACTKRGGGRSRKKPRDVPTHVHNQRNKCKGCDMTQDQWCMLSAMQHPVGDPIGRRRHVIVPAARAKVSLDVLTYCNVSLKLKLLN